MLVWGPVRRQLLGTQRRISPSALLQWLPVAGFAKKKKDDDDISSAPGRDNKISRLLKMLEVKPEDKMPPLSEEDAAEWKAATKEYNKLKLYETRLWQLDLSIKLQLKKAALAALPEELRAQADTTQTELVPLNRHIFTHTPPIPGFREQQLAGTGRKRGQRARQL